MKNIVDSGTVLDYVLFQLTPTRTRCDLVIFAGKKSEKIASGLLDPFLSHLKSAKDQISKGGYSITLQPSSSDASSWFTKATLSRFVRFLNTPEILERFVSIEKEIGQIEKELDSNGLANGTVEQNGADGDDAADTEEKPKVRLQRVLKSRKAILEKELAMAYARALVAGFEMDYLQDLASFSDAFGAQRLREACVKFMEICNRKNDDKIWMDEVAAVQASYIGSAGNMASFENNDLSQIYPTTSLTPDSITRQGSLDAGEGTESASNVELPQHTAVPTWRGNFPQYMQNAHGPYPMFPQMPPYPGYMFPGFQVPPSPYPPNMAWPGNFHNSGTNPNRDAKKKERKGEVTGTDSSDEEDATQRISTTEEQRHKKKPSKRSSGKVVIRNINFIAGGKNDAKGSDSDGYCSGGDEYVDADAIKQHVEAAVGSIKRNHKSKSKKDSQKVKNDSETEDVEPPHSEEEKTIENWDVFQNFLMKDSESRSETTGSRTVHSQENFGEEILNKKLEQNYASDDFLYTERSTGNVAKGSDVRFDGGEATRIVINRSNGEEVLIPNRAEGARNFQNPILGTESTLLRPQKEEDWITGGKSEWSASRLGGVDQSIYQASGNHFQVRNIEKDVMDDSFMVQTRSSEETKISHSKADIFMESDIVGGFVSESSVPQVLQEKGEPRKFSEPEDLYMISRHDSVTEQVVASWTPEMDFVNNAQKAKAEVVVPTEKRAKKVAAKDPKDTKSRIPSGYRSKSAVPTRSKISPPGSASTRSKVNLEEERRKRMEELLLQRQKRIVERSAANGTISENSKTVSKGISKTPASSQTGKTKPQAPVNENKAALHRNLTRSFTMDRLSTPRTINKPPSTESRVRPNSTTPASLKKTKGTVEHQEKVNPSDKKAKSKDATKNTPSKAQEADQPKNNGTNDFDTIKDLHTITSVEKKETEAVIKSDTKDSSIQVLSDDIISSQDAPVEDITTDLPCLPTPVTVNTTTATSGTALIPDIGVDKKKISFSSEVSVVDISTPPSYTETNAELSPQAPPRKKWGDGEPSPKAPKGFRKLLLFGRNKS